MYHNVTVVFIIESDVLLYSKSKPNLSTDLFTEEKMGKMGFRSRFLQKIKSEDCICMAIHCLSKRDFGLHNNRAVAL